MAIGGRSVMMVGACGVVAGVLDHGWQSDTETFARQRDAAA